MVLPALVQTFREPGCFTLQEAETLLGRSRAKPAIKYLRRAGYATTVRRGLYALAPERTGSSVDRYVLASKAVMDGVLSYHTALELLGVAQTTMFNTLYVRVHRRSAGFIFEDVTVRPVNEPLSLAEKEMVRKLKRGGTTIRVASRELALVDCAARPEYAGGVEELVKSIEGFSQLDWSRLERLISARKGNYGWGSLSAKLGFLLERNRGRWRCPDPLLDRLGRNVPKSITYFGAGRGKGGRWVKRWNVVVPPAALGGVG